MDKLADEVLRDLPGAVVIRQPAFGHVEGAEHQVQEGEGRREVLVAHLGVAGVVPAVEDRAGEDVLQRPEGPVQVGVHHGGGKEIEHRHDHEGERRKAHQLDQDADADGVDHRVDRMVAEGGGPVHLFSAVVHRVEGPERPGVERPVQPVLHHVHQEHDQEGLDRDRQVREPAVAGLHGREQPRLVGAAGQGQRPLDQGQGEIAVDQERDQEIGEINLEILAEVAGLARVAGPEPGQHAEDGEREGCEEDREDHPPSLAGPL